MITLFSWLLFIAVQTKTVRRISRVHSSLTMTSLNVTRNATQYKEAEDGEGTKKDEEEEKNECAEPPVTEGCSTLSAEECLGYFIKHEKKWLTGSKSTVTFTQCYVKKEKCKEPKIANPCMIVLHTLKKGESVKQKVRRCKCKFEESKSDEEDPTTAKLSKPPPAEEEEKEEKKDYKIKPVAEKDLPARFQQGVIDPKRPRMRVGDSRFM